MNTNHNIRKTIHKYAKTQPTNVAIEFGKETITYLELDLRIRHLSQQLQNVGVRKGDIVAICVSNSIELIISIYAVIYIRAIVLPIDIDSPIDRVQKIFTDSQPVVALCKKELQSEVARLNVKSIAVDSIVIDIDIEFSDYNTKDILEDDNVFCIYTSGSTGTPKGVLLNYKGVLNHALAKAELFNITLESKICLSFNIGFVASIWQILVPILSGALLVIYDKNLIKKPYQFFKQLEKDNITIISVTPHTLSAYMEYLRIGKQKLEFSNMQYVILTGEKININLVREFYEYYNHLTLINAYGQTECSDDTYHYVIPHSFNSENVPIGTPIANIKGFVLNDDLEEDKFGELYIGGIGVSKGYLRNQELTDTKFINSPLFDTHLYKTGDLVKQDDNGILVFVSRIDNQVKIHGHRIELEEIETTINNFEGISQSIVRIVDLNETDKILEAIYTGTQTINRNALKEFLAKKLPAYMIPAKFTCIDTFTYTSNGKIDRKNINIPFVPDANTESSKATNELSELQQKVFSTIKLNLDESIFSNIFIDTDLLGVGIDSITFIKIVISLEETFDFEFDNEVLLSTNFPTVRSMIEYVESKIS